MSRIIKSYFTKYEIKTLSTTDIEKLREKWISFLPFRVFEDQIHLEILCA